MKCAGEPAFTYPAIDVVGWKRVPEGAELSEPPRKRAAPASVGGKKKSGKKKKSDSSDEEFDNISDDDEGHFSVDDAESSNITSPSSASHDESGTL